MVDSVSFYSLLIGAGEQAENAKVLKGVYDRSIPLMQLGTVVTTSFSLSLIPIITAAKERGDLFLYSRKGKVSNENNICYWTCSSYWTNLYYSTYQYYVV